MSEHPAIKLTVMRFIPGEDAIEPDDSGMLTCPGLEPEGGELGTPHAPAQPEEQFSSKQIVNRPMGQPVFNT
ncbi:hypothetical protein D5086_010117 [Populus alba]|uniref:Uncharacterized protein n=1 Tax=Populus alba TaxID=43335 RepID=A0ACC4CB17_POPAL